MILVASAVPGASETRPCDLCGCDRTGDELRWLVRGVSVECKDREACMALSGWVAMPSGRNER